MGVLLVGTTDAGSTPERGIELAPEITTKTLIVPVAEDWRA